MPHERVLRQERLDDGVPHNYQANKVIRRVLRYSMGANGLQFEFHRDGADDTPKLPIDELNLDVYEDTEFYLRLSSQRDWHWSIDFDAITTKRDKKRYYGKVEYEIAPNTFVEWDGTGPKPWRSDRIRFLASLNQDGGDNAHSFSLNIDMVLAGGRILPISLDPDIQNPKVNFAEPVADPPPGLLAAV